MEYRKIYERDLMFSKKQTKSDVFNCARRLIHMDRCKKLIKRRIVSVILFVFALYLTEFSPFSGRAVALFNGGYGTFDMKNMILMCL